jgi:hypothetical protein
MVTSGRLKSKTLFRTCAPSIDNHKDVANTNGAIFIEITITANITPHINDREKVANINTTVAI